MEKDKILFQETLSPFFTHVLLCINCSNYQVDCVVSQTVTVVDDSSEMLSESDDKSLFYRLGCVPVEQTQHINNRLIKEKFYHFT